MALAAVVVPPAVFAQQTESRITGRVLDDSKAAHAWRDRHRHVEADRRRPDGSHRRRWHVYHHESGPGSYTVAFELSGFATQTRDVVLGVGQVETVDITMASRGCRRP